MKKKNQIKDYGIDLLPQTPQATTTTNKVKDRQEGEIEKYKIKVNRIHKSQWITKDKNYRNCCFIGSLFYLGELDGEYELIR